MHNMNVFNATELYLKVFKIVNFYVRGRLVHRTLEPMSLSFA